MTDSATPQPDWSLLPHDAEAFFGLAPGFSRRDLKQKYSRLIKVYKPEKAPVEFQKIRAAFDQLAEPLRYGESIAIRDVTPASIFGQTSEVSSERPESLDLELRSTVSSPQKTAARIRSDSPATVYQELATRAGKTPFDYYALAVLSDTLPEFNPQRFFNWLLAGLRQFPEDPALLRMLHWYLRANVSPRSIRRILLVTASTVRNDRFYSLTEPLWDELLRTSPFEEFRQTLKHCESRLQDRRLEGRVAFLMHILKPALWKADGDWIEETFRIVDEHLGQVSRATEAEMELLNALREYIAVRSTFLNGHPLRSQIDQSIHDYCCLPAPQNARSYIECQLRMASNGGELLEAFPFMMSGADDSVSTMSQIWFWINFDVRDAKREDAGTTDKVRPTPGKILRFVRSLEARTRTSTNGVIWEFSDWIYHLFDVLGVFIAPAILTWLATSLILVVILLMNSDDTIVIRVLLSLFAGWAGGLALQKFVLPRLWEKFCQAMAVRCYVRLWRREVQQFLRRTQIDVDELADSIKVLNDEENLEYGSWVPDFANADQALPLYVSAQRFLV